MVTHDSPLDTRSLPRSRQCADQTGARPSSECRISRQNDRIERPGTPYRAGIIAQDHHALEKPAKLRGDLICLKRLGIDPNIILRGSGVSFDEILAQKPLPTPLIAALIDRLVEVAPAGFGITAGLAVRLHDLGMLGYWLSQCETIGALLKTWTRYSIIIGYPLGSIFQTSRQGWTIEFYPRYSLSTRAPDFCIESTLSGFTQSVYNMTGHRLHLTEVAFSSARRYESAFYQEIDARHLMFDQSHPHVAGELADLALPMPATDPEMHAVCEAFCRESLLRMHGEEPLARRVRDIMVHTFTTDAVAVGRVLGISVRSMQRILAAEGASFHEIVESHRRTRAMEMVQKGFGAKIIAHQLNYSSVTSYYRAFRRWTGDNPGGWLTQQRFSSTHPEPAPSG